MEKFTLSYSTGQLVLNMVISHTRSFFLLHIDLINLSDGFTQKSCQSKVNRLCWDMKVAFVVPTSSSNLQVTRQTAFGAQNTTCFSPWA